MTTQVTTNEETTTAGATGGETTDADLPRVNNSHDNRHSFDGQRGTKNGQDGRSGLDRSALLIPDQSRKSHENTDSTKMALRSRIQSISVK